MKTYRVHNEVAQAKVRASLAAVNQELDNLVGWAETAGYPIERMVKARGLLRAEFNVLVVGHEEEGLVVE